MGNCSFTTVRYRVPLAILLLFSLNISSNSQSTWDGGAGTNNWMDAENWNNDTLPQSDQNVLLINADVVIPNSAIVEIEYLQMCCQSTLTIEPGGSIVAEYIGLQHAGTEITNNGFIQITGGHVFGISLGGHTYMENHGTIDIDNSGPDGAIKLFAATLLNNGSIDINTSTGNGDGIHTFNFSGTESIVTNNGSITISNTMGDGISGDGILHNYGSVDITNVTYFEDLLLDGETGLDFNHYSGATFTGDGNLDPTTFNWLGGEFSTETSAATPGIVQFFCLSNCTGEDFTNSMLRFNVEGTDGPGVATGHDQVQVNQNAILGGTFEIILGSSYIPSAGDEFTIMTYASKTGDDPAFLLPPLPSGLQWETEISATSINISMSSALPVELVFFEAENKESYIELNWETASEINNRGFFLEKSDDGIQWELLDFIEGAGNNYSTIKYQYEDLDPYPGKNYYRLVQSDFDGSQNKSNIVAVNFKQKNISDEINVYPNPIKRGSQLNISFFGEDIYFDKASIYSEKGQIIYSLYDITEKTELNTSDFTKGAYWIILENKVERVTKRFIVIE